MCFCVSLYFFSEMSSARALSTTIAHLATTVVCDKKLIARGPENTNVYIFMQKRSVNKIRDAKNVYILRARLLNNSAELFGVYEMEIKRRHKGISRAAQN
jgi:hypothetical protein